MAPFLCSEKYRPLRKAVALAHTVEPTAQRRRHATLNSGAVASIAPPDQPLQDMQDMQTQLTDVLASVHGNEITSQDFMLVKQAPQPVDESAAQAQQIAGLFQAASAENAAH